MVLHWMKEYHLSVPNNHMRKRSSTFAYARHIRRFIPLNIRMTMTASLMIAQHAASVQVKMRQVGEIYLESPDSYFYISDMCKVSIIIPIFKVEAYLSECLESVRRQSGADFEVIMVDDGSPDNSAAICREFAEKDARFRLIQQENAGVTAARRTGVNHATGEYVVFVDGDDTLPPDALGILLSYMSNDVDIVVGQPDCDPLVTEKQLIDIAEYRRKLICGKSYLAMWARLFRRSLFDDFTFELTREIRAGEDWIANLRLAFNTEKKVLLVPDLVYRYRQNEEGVSLTIRRTLEHARLVYDGLRASVPARVHAEYLPILARQLMPAWVRYTRMTCCLSKAALDFRALLLAAASPSQLCLRDTLFLRFTNPVVRALLIALCRMQDILRGLKR